MGTMLVRRHFVRDCAGITNLDNLNCRPNHFLSHTFIKTATSTYVTSSDGLTIRNIHLQFIHTISVSMMFLRILTLTVLYAQDALAQASGSQLGADGFIRFGCSQLVVERTDPLVTPGMNPSPHMQYVYPLWNIFGSKDEVVFDIVSLARLLYIVAIKHWHIRLC